MSYCELVELAKQGMDIELSIQTFTEVNQVLKYLKPFGYKIKKVSSFLGLGIPNCIFTKN